MPPTVAMLILTASASVVGATVVVPISNGVGQANAILTKPGAGAVVVTLDLVDSGGTGLDVTDTCTCTFT